LLEIVIHSEERLTNFDDITLFNRKRLHAADFIGRNKNEIGFDPALIGAIALTAGAQQ
jgi:hypothetical protein